MATNERQRWAAKPFSCRTPELTASPQGEAVDLRSVPGFASGDLSVPVAAEYPLEEAAAAYARFKAGGKFGKVVLTAQ